MTAMTRDERRERVRTLRDQGVSYREIGRRLGISHEQARQDAGLTHLTALTPVPPVADDSARKGDAGNNVVPAPDGLGDRGRAFWEHTTSEFHFDRHDLELLTQLCRLLDRLDALRAYVEENGLMLTSPQGAVRANPALAEERQVTLAIGRLVAQMQIPGEGSNEPSIVASPWSRRASTAANRRWKRHKQLRGEDGD